MVRAPYNCGVVHKARPLPFLERMSASPRPSSDVPVRSVFVQRRPLPALGMPRAREDRRAGALLSLALHLLVVLLLVTPFAVHHAIVERAQGAGGAGPAGGGGGGHGGTGGVLESERLQYIEVAPAPPPAATPVQPAQPVPPSPVPPPQPVKVDETPNVDTKVDVSAAVKVPAVSLVSGVGGGTGRDGTNGSGPGTGGGVGTGIGTGRGSGLGPGTGGGNQENYPPTLQEMPIPPLPVPDKAHGAHVIAEFDVDSTGRVLSYDFSRTKDGGYNKKLEDVFRHYRFTPGTTPDGKPLRMKVQVIMDLP